jgi:hypothetical protein
MPGMKMHQLLKGGVSRGEITPEPGPVLQGHWGAPASHCVLRPLEVRALVFEFGAHRAAIATIDVIGVTRGTTHRIRRLVEEICGIPFDGVMVICSHTHCAPATLPCMGLGPSAAWLDRIEREVAACVGRAAQSLHPVRLGLGCGAVHISQSRRPGSGGADSSANPVDRRVRVLRIERPDRSVLATVFHHACHATALSGLRGLMSPDYPGPARDLIEAAVGGTALFVPGCGGDLRPPRDDPGDDEGEARSRLETCGRTLGKEVCRTVERIDTAASGPLRTARVDVDMPFGVPLPVERLRELAEEDSELARGLTGPWARRVLQLIEAQSIPRVRSTEMQAISVGPLTCVGIPGEPLQAIGLALERRLEDVARSQTVWPVGYANDQIGYFCTEHQHAEGGYEPTAYPFYDEPAPFRDEERVILEAATRLSGNPRSSASS